MGEEQYRRMIELLREEQVEYVLCEHEPVYTSEQAAKARGVELKSGVKAMVLKKNAIDGGNSSGEKTDFKTEFLLADIAANRRLDFKKLERLLGTSVKKLELAKRKEVVEVTGCEAGSVHPIGRLFGLDTYLDKSVLENEFVNFNIGLLTKSVRIKKDELVRILKAEAIADFSKF